MLYIPHVSNAVKFNNSFYSVRNKVQTIFSYYIPHINKHFQAKPKIFCKVHVFDFLKNTFAYLLIGSVNLLTGVSWKILSTFYPYSKMFKMQTCDFVNCEKRSRCDSTAQVMDIMRI